MLTLSGMQRLQPCALCPTRMAVPGGPLCTVCDIVTLPGLIPDDAVGLTSAPLS